MKTIQTRGHIDADGILDLRVPTGLPEADVHVVVVVEPAQHHAAGEQGSWDEFLDRFAGIFADDPLIRGDQGEYEKREPLD